MKEFFEEFFKINISPLSNKQHVFTTSLIFSQKYVK